MQRQGVMSLAALSQIVAKQCKIQLKVAAPVSSLQCRGLAGEPQAAEDSQPTFESSTISDILRQKGAGNDGSWLWCSTNDTVYDAVKSMTSNNVGALLVMKDDDSGGIAGIITERDYLRKIIVQGRSSKTTKVGDIMTEENKLITVTPDTKVLKAMELMTVHRIRHIPVSEDRKMKGMVSIGDVVGAVVREHRQEVERLNAYIQGQY
jgi:signal-transduction protein with cAMP-binding, CBS, and nucleotidyltransferase domain